MKGELSGLVYSTYEGAVLLNTPLILLMLKESKV